MRRIAWKQCRSCSADSLSMWPDSLASYALAGWIRSPRASSTRGHRVLREPVDLEVGMQLAQLVGDGGVALGVAEADRRGDVERALAPRLAPRPAPRLAGGGSTKSRRSRFTFTGSRTCGDMAAALQRHELAAGRLGERRAARVRADASSSPWMTSTGQRTRRTCPGSVSSTASAWREIVSTSVAGSVSSPQPTRPRSASSSAAR